MKQMYRWVVAALVVLLWLGNVAGALAEGRPFITKWQGRAGEALKIPILGKDYKLVIKNNKGEVVKSEAKFTIEDTDTPRVVFTPTTDGVYTVEAGPEGVSRMYMRELYEDGKYIYPTSNDKLLEVVQFGTVEWESMKSMFCKCEQMTFAGNLDIPNLSKVTDMSYMFYGCSSFNQPLEEWDVSQVTKMNSMFKGCSSFNQPLEKWTVGKVTDMNDMFRGCSAFNQPLEKWKVGKVTDMNYMFVGCSAFNQPLEGWDVSKVTNMNSMFSGCSSFNQPLEKWDVSQVTKMLYMFNGCSSFNQPLEKWDVSKVTNMWEMFNGCRSFNQPLEGWNVGQVTDMYWMFYGCSSFNQPLEGWNVSQVTSMKEMFSGCSSFDQPLGAWKLNCPIGGLSSTAMSPSNYSKTLAGWASQTDGASDLHFDGPYDNVGSLVYNDEGKAAREKLIARGWTFKGDRYQPHGISINKPWNRSYGWELELGKELEIPIYTWGSIGASETITLSCDKRKVISYQLSPDGKSIRVKGLSQEYCTLTATIAAKEGVHEELSSNCHISVYVPIESLKFEPSKVTLEVGQAIELKLLATPAHAKISGTGGSYDSEIIDRYIQDYHRDMIKGLKVGKTTLVVSTTSGGKTVEASCEIEVKEAPKMPITLAATGEGKIRIEGYTTEQLNAIPRWTTLKVLAEPEEGVALISLKAGDKNIFHTREFTVTEPTTVKAEFKHLTRPFITQWQGKAGKAIELPILGKDYKLVIKNNKGEVVKSEAKLTIANADTPYAFTPMADGLYTVEAGPMGVESMQMADSHGEAPREELQSVVQFGDIPWTSMLRMFRGCRNMTFAAGIDVPNLACVTDMSGIFAGCTVFNQPLEKWDVSQVTNMSRMFYGCTAFNQPLEGWNVSQVTDMSDMFHDCSAFNQPLEKWDVSQVTSMSRMFGGCTAFNQPLEGWKLSQVTDMREMFYGCTSFNQPLEKWNVSQVTSMSGMFDDCTAFNQPLEKWDVSQVTDMSGMFGGCTAFNQPLEGWNVGNVRYMAYMFAYCYVFNQPLEKWNVGNVTHTLGMFRNCSSFNQPLEKWDVSKVFDIKQMFYGCTAFNQPLEGWNVSQVTDMSGMFDGCTAFNQPLEGWNVSQVTNMSGMFRGCSTFNQPLEKWDVSKVTNMYGMFRGCTAFNQPLEGWNVSQVTNMYGMFYGCTAFNQPLEGWNVSKVTNMYGMFGYCRSFNQPLGGWKLNIPIIGLSSTAMSPTNYSKSLDGWASQTGGANNIRFGEYVRGLIYNDLGKAARDKLIARGWTFEGDIYQASGVAITPNPLYLVQGTEFVLNVEKWGVEESESISLSCDQNGLLSYTLAPDGKSIRVKGLSVGKCNLTATIAAKEGVHQVYVGSCQVQVYIPVEDITITGLETLKVGEKATFTATVSPANATEKGVEWYSSDTDIATVSETGEVTAKAVGQCRIGAGSKEEGNPFSVWESRWIRVIANPDLPKVAISLAKEGDGTISIEDHDAEALKAVPVGTQLTVLTEPAAGYVLTSLKAGTEDILKTKKFVVTAAVEVKAVFTKQPKMVAITLAKEGEGSLSIKDYDAEALKAVVVGTELTVETQPASGYVLTSLMAGETSIFATKRFTVTDAVEVKAVFVKQEDAPKVAITLVTLGEGSLSIKDHDAEALKAVPVGTQLTVVVQAAEGYTLQSLKAGSEDILLTKMFTVTEAMEVTAVFKKKEESNPNDQPQPPVTPQAVEDVALASIVVAPNPFTSQLRIANPASLEVRYELVNVTGVVVRSGVLKGTDGVIATEDLPQSVYIMRFYGVNSSKKSVVVVKY